MSSGGPKMVERSYGVAGNGLKCPKNQEITGNPRWPPSSLVGPIPVRPAEVGREISRPASSECPPPPCPARVAGGRPVVPLLVQTPTARKWSKMVQLGFMILEGFS